jgi:hypothetical protein
MQWVRLRAANPTQRRFCFLDGTKLLGCSDTCCPYPFNDCAEGDCQQSFDQLLHRDVLRSRVHDYALQSRKRHFRLHLWWLEGFGNVLCT